MFFNKLNDNPQSCFPFEPSILTIAMRWTYDLPKALSEQTGIMQCGSRNEYNDHHNILAFYQINHIYNHNGGLDDKGIVKRFVIGFDMSRIISGRIGACTKMIYTFKDFI